MKFPFKKSDYWLKWAEVSKYISADLNLMLGSHVRVEGENRLHKAIL